jgi:hypothetical protein
MNNKGFDHFDIVYYINLNHRKDRLLQINDELSKINISKDKIHKIEAVFDSKSGALGCSKSHILVLEEFIKSGKENCLILEDDFEFNIDLSQACELLNNFFSTVKSFDVLMLGGKVWMVSDTNLSWLKKAQYINNTHCYCVSKAFAPILLANFKEGASKLEHIVNSNGDDNHDNRLDMYWIRLQYPNNWFIINPAIGRQRESFSDVANQFINYNV